MLLTMLKSIARDLRGKPQATPPAAPQAAPDLSRPAAPPPRTPHDDMMERMQFIARMHAASPLDRHTAILFRDIRVGGMPLEEVVGQSVAKSQVDVPPFKHFHRRLAQMGLAQYFRHALELPGRWAECGVFRGTSSLTLCQIGRALKPGFDGTGLHLVDSFEGLSEPHGKDAVTYRDAAGEEVEAGYFKMDFATDMSYAKAAVADFPGVALHKGWIPEVFSQLPEDRWSFVHIDVDLYDPTLRTLEYFHPRLSPGAVMISDDYGSPMYPGAHRAWDEFFRARNLPFVLLPTGQSVYLHAG